MKRTTWLVVGVAVVAAICGLLSCNGPDQKNAVNAPAAARVNPDISKPGMNIDPTAVIHPSVILDGKVSVGAYTNVGAGTILTGAISIGHHTIIACNSTLRGRITVGNYTHIYDNVNIEGGRPAKPTGGSLAEVADQAIIGDHCWINHGAIMHGTQIADGGAVGMNTACDYNTRIGKNAVLADGSATRVDMVICDGCFFEGVPAVLKKKGLTEEDRAKYFGVSPLAWTTYAGDRQEATAKKRLADGK
jgi:carbonic anhydrase/acetyltransferase-like protein (isoleucine patch superfamily)